MRTSLAFVACAGVRAPHCFFICLDEIIMKDLVKFCNYFCNIKLLNVKKDSFNILLTQKYDILVININNLSNSQINVLVELMKNGIYKNKKCFFPISTTFWVYAVKPYIRNEQVRNRVNDMTCVGVHLCIYVCVLLCVPMCI